MANAVISVLFSTEQDLMSATPASLLSVPANVLKSAAKATPQAFGLTFGTLSATALSANIIETPFFNSNVSLNNSIQTATVTAINAFVDTLTATNTNAIVLSGTEFYAVSTFNASLSGGVKNVGGVKTVTNYNSLARIYGGQYSDGTFSYGSVQFTGLQYLVTPSSDYSLYYVKGAASAPDFSSRIYAYRRSSSFGSAGAVVPGDATYLADADYSPSYHSGCSFNTQIAFLTAFKTSSNAPFYVGLFAYSGVYYPDLAVEEYILNDY